MDTIYVSDASAICSLGDDLDKIAQKILANEHGFTRDHRYSAWIDAPCGTIGDFDAEVNTDDVIVKMAFHTIETIDRHTHFLSRYRPEEIGLFIGTTAMGAFATVGQFKKLKTEQQNERELCWQMQQNTLTEQIQRRFPIRGFANTFSSACSSGAMAILQASYALRSGICKACLAGGFDALNLMTLLGFDSLQVLSRNFCQPFANNRSTDEFGINLGDGGGLLLLEIVKPDAPLGIFLGGAACSEGYHMTHPDPSGKGMALSMDLALRASAVESADVVYINAHGSGTSANDLAEEAAIKSVFDTDVLVQSTKAWHGHTLGGAGALEAILTLKALARLEMWSKRCFSGSYAALRPTGIGLSNSFGFGGANVSLVFQG